MTAWKNDLLSTNFKENTIKVEVKVFITVVNGSRSAENAGNSTHSDSNESL